jgi:hypothetical protein
MIYPLDRTAYNRGRDDVAAALRAAAEGKVSDDLYAQFVAYTKRGWEKNAMKEAAQNRMEEGEAIRAKVYIAGLEAARDAVSARRPAWGLGSEFVKVIQKLIDERKSRSPKIFS